MSIKYPIVGVGAVVILRNKVLLIKRAKPPSQYQWAIPGGKVKLGETLQSAAERELKEETGLTIKAGKSIFTFEHIEKNKLETTQHYIVIDLLAEYVSGNLQAGSDATEAKWFNKEDVACTDNINTTTRKLLKEIEFI